MAADFAFAFFKILKILFYSLLFSFIIVSVQFKNTKRLFSSGHAQLHYQHISNAISRKQYNVLTWKLTRRLQKTC